MSEKKISKQKIKLLYIIDILTKKSDEKHPISANYIIDCLKNDYGIECERKTIYDSIDCLIEYGYDIVRSKSPRGYFMALNQFEYVELRLLMDAVQAANFISVKKTEQLLGKLSAFTSEYNYNKLYKQVYINDKYKSKNEKIFYIIDDLNTAIMQNKQVSIVYQRRKIVENKVAKYSEKTMLINPYAMTWYNDHYYLIGNNDKYDNLTNLRIDRIKSVDILDNYSKSYERITNCQGKFDVSDYVNKHFSMFAGDIKPIELVCDNSIIEAVIDRFGEKVKLNKYDDEHFLVTSDVAVNDGFVSWIMQYGKDIRVEKPFELKMMVKDKASEILNIYNH